MRPLRQITAVRRFVQIAFLAFAIICDLPDANAGFTFNPGHIYSTWTFGNTTNVIEYSADGTFLGSLTIPSLLQDDELRGIAFGSDGLLYAVMVHFADSGFQVLALDSSGTVHQTYRMEGIYIWGGGSYGKIAVDDQGKREKVGHSHQALKCRGGCHRIAQTSPITRRFRCDFFWVFIGLSSANLNLLLAASGSTPPPQANSHTISRLSAGTRVPEPALAIGAVSRHA